MKSSFSLALLSLIGISVSASATVRFVDLNCATPASPYTNWATAATTIQDAVDAAANHDLILVTNGVYASGGRAMIGTMTNRVTVNKSVTVQSVNGPTETVIQGYQVPGTTNGDGAIRCVFLGSDAVLSGFTLTKGATRSSGDSYTQGSGGGVYSGTTSTLVTNCVITGNAAYYRGGGGYNTWLVDCVLSTNSSIINAGGGAYGGSLERCRISGNSAAFGGGVSDASLVKCVAVGNSANSIGGANNCSLYNCTIIGNSARVGGGVVGGRLQNSIVYFNRAAGPTANYDSATLDHCCTTPMPSTGEGNITGEPQLASDWHLSAASPCRSAGKVVFPAAERDIDGEPWGKPPSMGCDEYYVGSVTGELTAAISAAFTNVAVGFGVDLAARIDGRTSASVWDFGDGVIVSNRPYASHAWNVAGSQVVVLTAYNESHPEGVKATLTVQVQDAPVHYVSLESANAVAPYTSWATAAGDIQSAVDAATLPGALVLVNDGSYSIGGRAVYGTMTNRVAVDRPVVVQSVNGPAKTAIVGAQAPTGGNGEAAVRCVYLSDGASLSGFTLTNGATRAILDEREGKGGAIWCSSSSAAVTNCVMTGNSAYERAGGVYGGTLYNCTLTNNSSAQDGGGVYGSVLTDCALAGNSAGRNGGGAYLTTLANSVIAGNSASMDGGGVTFGTLNNCVLTNNSAKTGGGASRAVMSNCLLAHNSASGAGGGSWSGTLNNCTLTQNSASRGGGASSCTLNNCILFFNTADIEAGSNYDSAVMTYCCTAPLPSGGVGNFTNDPLFLDLAAGDLHLQSNSPCINAGRNAYVSTSIDLDGNSQIVGGAVDVGAYEFQAPLSVLSYAWLQSCGLATDGSADYLDCDSDGMNNWQEWIVGTDPTNSASALFLLAPSCETNGVTLTWQSSSNITYFIERTTALSGAPGFATISPPIPGGFPTTTFTDTNSPTPGPVLYRLGVKSP